MIEKKAEIIFKITKDEMAVLLAIIRRFDNNPGMNISYQHSRKQLGDIVFYFLLEVPFSRRITCHDILDSLYKSHYQSL